MTDDLASGWPTQDAPPPPEEIDDPTPDPGINFDAILRRLESSQSRPAASLAPSIPALIPATPPTAWSNSSPASAADQPTDIESNPPTGREIPHPIGNTDHSMRDVEATIARTSVAFAGISVARPQEFRSQTSDPNGVIPSYGTNVPNRETGDTLARPGVRSPSTPPATSIDRLRLEPPSFDLGLGASARPGPSPEAASTPLPISGGAGAGDAAGFAGSRQGVSPEDLLKTNELLRQLVEETRRLRVAALPAASPSAYPAR